MATRFGFLRPLRGLLLLLSLATMALAAEHNWIASLRVGNSTVAEWLERLTFDESPAPDNALPDAPAVNGDSTYSTSRWLNPVLFSQPSSGWSFEPPKSISASIRESQGTALPANVPAASTLPSAFFSSGFISYSSIAFGPSPNAPDGGPPPVGEWISNASGNWGNPSNWKDGIIPSSGGSVAHIEMLDITTDVTVTLDTSRIIGELDVGDTNGTHRYDVAPGSSGQRLFFDGGSGTAILHQSSTSAGDTISVPVFLNSDLLISNASTTNPFNITGGITANRATPSVQQVTFTGTVNVSGGITPGTSGAVLNLDIQGNVNLSGTNTYNGTTFVTGHLFVKGDNSGATGSVQVAGGGSLLSGIGTVGGAVTIYGGTITGGDTSTVGTLTLLQTLNINASEGSSGTYLANLDGAASDLLAITGTLNIGSGTTLDIHGTADGMTTYVLATFAGGGLSGMFDFVNGLPADYTLVYTSSDIELVPTAIPEPATWIGGALIAFALIKRRRNPKSQNPNPKSASRTDSSIGE